MDAMMLIAPAPTFTLHLYIPVMASRHWCGISPSTSNAVSNLEGLSDRPTVCTC